MTVIEAVVEHGLLRPLTPITLSEGQRVRLSIEPIVAETPNDVVELLGRAGDGLTSEQWKMTEIHAS
jgi:predicted DNA-binding antitoxin AbrB/MazE fold protein